MTIFTYKDVFNKEHELVFVQHTQLQQMEDPIFHHPIVTLCKEFEVIPASSIDQMVELKPRQKMKNNYYVITEIKEY